MRLRMVGWCALALAAVPPAARTAALGVSLGLTFPGDRLSGGPGPLGAPLRPAPTIGLTAGPSPEGDDRPLSWNVTAEFARFESDADPGLTALCVPVQVGGIWRAVTVQEGTLEARLAGGVALLAARSGVSESMAVPMVSFGGGFRHPVHRLSAVLEFEAGALLEQRPQAMFQVRLVLQTR